MWKINNNRIQFITVSKKYTDFLRNNIDSKIPTNIKNRCCDFIELEKHYKEYLF